MRPQKRRPLAQFLAVIRIPIRCLLCGLLDVCQAASCSLRVYVRFPRTGSEIGFGTDCELRSALDFGNWDFSAERLCWPRLDGHGSEWPICFIGKVSTSRSRILQQRTCWASPCHKMGSTVPNPASGTQPRMAACANSDTLRQEKCVNFQLVIQFRGLVLPSLAL